MSKVRVEAPGPVGYASRVFFIDDDGNETEISNVCCGLQFDITMQEPNKTVVELIKVEGTIEADLVDTVVKAVKPRSWRGRIRDITTFGDIADRWIRA